MIIGLLVGGILAGRSLIRASELRSVSRDISSYMTAMRSFQDKYFALPGDISNAISFWGLATNCPGAYNQPSTDSSTCNGDADGRVEYFGVATSHEHFRIWQHLANAGLIEGQYSGVPTNDASTPRAYDASNSPLSKISKRFYAFASYGISSGGAGSWWDGNVNNELGLAQFNSSVGTGALYPEDMWNIDSKMDDGVPSYGKLRSQRTGNCTTTTVETTAAYDLSYTAGTSCLLRFYGFQ